MIPNYGFNTVVTESWLPLASVLIDSILSFSKYPIIINCINFDYKHSSERVISKTIDLSSTTFANICLLKWISLLNNPYDICAMLDADMVATPEIDNLFETNAEKTISAKFPLFAKHPHNPFENPSHIGSIDQLCKIFSNNSPKMKWVYACGLIAQHHKPFVAELIDSFNRLESPPYIEDEGLLNALLVKYGVDKDIGYNYIPNSSLLIDYLSKNTGTSSELYHTYLKFDCPVNFFLLHGCKDNGVATQILDSLKNMKL